MKKLHSLALFTMLTPAITLSSGLALAQQTTGQDLDREQSTQHQAGQTQRGLHQPGSSQSGTAQTGTSQTGSSQTGSSQPGTAQSSTGSSQDNQSTLRPRQSEGQSAAERLNAGNQSRTENRGFLDAAPSNGMSVSDLMDADVKTSNDEDVGSVNDLIIDEDGQIVAIVIGVGGFLGMGEKDVAIGWDDVTRSNDSDDARRSATGSTAATGTAATRTSASGMSDDYDLRISMTREELRSAPEFKRNE